jgi:hypothetical protein
MQNRLDPLPFRGLPVEKMILRLKRTLYNILLVALCLIILTGSITPPDKDNQRVRQYTRSIEFDYVTWGMNALLRKNEQAALGLANHMPADQQTQLVNECVEVTRLINNLQAALQQIYGDPHDPRPDETAQPLKEKLDYYQRGDRTIAPLCEAILQQQVSELLAELGLTSAGQPIPPVLYHATPLPMALIVSPRNAIQQTANISLLAELSIDETIALEKQVETGMDVSALVVPIGGVGVYPTMVKSTSDLAWQIEVIAHEWIHNYLTLRPLGINYDTSSELRTMNETTANLAGKEISQAVLARYYPQYLPPEPAPAPDPPPMLEPENEPEPVPVFDFRAEMRETRVTVDELLAEGKIEEAEAYMESRRQMFWDKGFQIRRLNQAYFAFYGAYADQPGGAAGSDPVGPAVTELRQRSPSLAHFIRTIARMTSFDELQKALESPAAVQN